MIVKTKKIFKFFFLHLVTNVKYQTLNKSLIWLIKLSSYRETIINIKITKKTNFDN